MADDGRGNTKLGLVVVGLISAVTVFGFVMYSGTLPSGKTPVTAPVKLALPTFKLPPIERPVTTGSGADLTGSAIDFEISLPSPPAPDIPLPRPNKLRRNHRPF
jgi:hypothetical protein